MQNHKNIDFEKKQHPTVAGFNNFLSAPFLWHVADYGRRVHMRWSPGHRSMPCKSQPAVRVVLIGFELVDQSGAGAVPVRLSLADADQ